MLDLRTVYRIFKETRDRAIFYLYAHDPWSKPSALQSSAWDAYEEIAKQAEDIDARISEDVKNFLKTCRPAFEAMNGFPQVIHKEHFPVAAEAIHYLAECLDHVVKLNPGLLDGIPQEEVFSAYMFHKINWFIAGLKIPTEAK